MTITLDRNGWAADVAVALAGMPAHCAATLRMSYFDHLPEDEIAARTRMSLAQVRAALATGLQILGRPVVAGTGWQRVHGTS